MACILPMVLDGHEPAGQLALFHRQGCRPLCMKWIINHCPNFRRLVSHVNFLRPLSRLD